MNVVSSVSAGFRLAIGWGMLMVWTRAGGAEVTAESVPQYDRIFQQTNGWAGADGDFAVTLTNDLTLWLFSDTFIGGVEAGRRVHATMVNNSAAWQHGADPDKARVEFFYDQSLDGSPASLIKPVDGKGWFWLFDGLMVRGKLFLFLAQIEDTGDKSVFGFRRIGTWLGEVSNSLAPPTRWRVVQRKIPFSELGGGDSPSFGSAVLATNGYVYVFGTREHKGRGKAMVLGRVPEDSIGDFASWQFRTKAGWGTNVLGAAGLCGGVASEFSVSWLPGLQRYVLICTENGLSKNIIARTAPAPWGPWSAARVVYRCPEAHWGRNIFCYAAKAHPMLATAPDEMIVTYAANSYDFWQVVKDARLYWPRFVRVTWH